MAGSGQEVIKSAIGEGIKLVGKIAKSGKSPTEKDFKEAVQAVLFSALAGGLLKNMSGFQKKWVYQSKDTLQGKILPDALAKLQAILNSSEPAKQNSKSTGKKTTKNKTKKAKQKIDHVLRHIILATCGNAHVKVGKSKN